MARNVVFLVHGIGEQRSGWEKPIIDCLVAQSRKYEYFKNRSLKQEVEFVPLGYDDVFRNRLKKWDDAQDELGEFIAGTPGLDDLMDWINDAGVDQNFIWSHAMDVVLYRFHPPTRRLIQSRIIEKMAKKIDAVVSVSAGTPISVMAHSLGTSVAHDCIHHLGAHRWGGDPNGFAPNFWRFASITMLANTSRLLETDVPQGGSIVRPGLGGDESSYCDYFINIRHEYDPVPLPRMFSDSGFAADLTLNKRVVHFHEPNIHAWTHYLINPRVHIPFFQEAVHWDAVSTDEETREINAFPKWGGAVEPVARPFRDDLEDLVADVDLDPSPTQIVQMLWALRTVADNYRSSAGGAQ